MFKPFSRVTNNPHRAAVNETQHQQRPRVAEHASSNGRFTEAIRRIGSVASRLFAGAMPEARSADQNRRHAMRSIHFSSSEAASKRAEFPFQVHHKFSAGESGSNKPLTMRALLPQLADSLSNKQGFIYIRDGSGNSPLASFVDSLRNYPSVSVGNDCSIIGAYQTPAETASIFSPQWTFQIYDANLEISFEVPVTEVPLQNLQSPKNRTEQLIHLKNCMDSHLRALPNEYKDSPVCPTIICPQLPRLAQLITAQEECLGRQTRGELNCKQGIDWIYAAEDTLKTISPEVPHFVGEESCDFESFFNLNGIHALGDNTVPFSIALAGGNFNDASTIRAFKRHLINPTAKTPATTPATAPSRTPATFTASKVATRTPNWLNLRNQGLAFKEPQLQMQCASQAVNSLLQRHEMDPENVAAFVINQKLRMLEQLGIQANTQSGLMHPTVIRAISQGRSVSISKAEFLGTTPNEICVATELEPTQAWRQLINIGAVERDQNWVAHANELASINQMTISPEDWLSVQRGTEMRDLLELVNASLGSSRQAHQPRSMTHLNAREQSHLIAQQEHRAHRFIAKGRDFPIIVRTGQQSGHYFTIVPDQHGNWLGLNATGTQFTGIQPCQVFCRAGELTRTLQRLNASDILVPTPQLSKRK